MSAEEAALHAEYRRLLMVREDERDHARIAEVSAAEIEDLESEVRRER